MGSPLPPDPYLALGVPKDATAAAIKSQYRKLVLKFHPDKVKDEAQKQIASDQFHQIQTAWEIIGDEDKRQRFDAQCKLAELRKDVMERQGGGGGGRGAEVRTAAYKVPTEAPRAAQMYARGPERTDRVSPTYEERKPAGYSQAYASDYFDPANRSSARKDTDYERASKRTSPRDDRDRKAAAKSTKESERMRRKESDRRAQRDIRSDRDRKAAYVVDEPESSDPDDYERQSRRTREEAELRRAREAYHEQAKRDKMDAQRGYYDAEERARKIYSQYDGAREYMEKSRSSRQRGESERRPSPVRMSSSKDKVEYIKREGRPSVMVRKGSSRPKTAGRETEERRAEGGRRSSGEYDEPRRPAPPLHQSKSSPADIKMPFERERSASVQVDSPVKEEPTPRMKRADTMPQVPSAGRERESRRRDNAPQKGSTLRQTEMSEGLPTPGATPDYQGPAASKYKYNEEYADDHEYPTPDGYRTEVRQPAAGSKARYTRSPSPMREPQRESDKRRATSSRYPTTSERPAPLPRTTSTSYVYNPSQGGVESYSRPSMSRENSRLYGEIPTARDTKSLRQSASRYSPPAGDGGVRYQREIRPEDVRMQSGYHSRRPSEAQRPSYSRSGSNYGQSVHVR